jgi:hypothetical protein
MSWALARKATVPLGCDALQENSKSTKGQITYEDPLVSYLTYNGPNLVS